MRGRGEGEGYSIGRGTGAERGRETELDGLAGGRGGWGLTSPSSRPGSPSLARRSLTLAPRPVRHESGGSGGLRLPLPTEETAVGACARCGGARASHRLPSRQARRARRAPRRGGACEARPLENEFELKLAGLKQSSSLVSVSL